MGSVVGAVGLGWDRSGWFGLGCVPEATGTIEEILENKLNPLVGIVFSPFPHRKNNSVRVVAVFGGSFFLSPSVDLSYERANRLKI